MKLTPKRTLALLLSLLVGCVATNGRPSETPSANSSAVPRPLPPKAGATEIGTLADESTLHWDNTAKKFTVKTGGITGTQIASAIKDPAAGTAGLRTLGTGAAQAAAGNDSRLSDARTPTAHATSHKNGGGDEVATATPAANAIPKAGSGGQLAIGWVASGTPDGTKFVRDDGTLAAPSGGGDMTLSGTQTVTGTKTFNSTKLVLAGSTSGTTTLNANATAGSGTVTLPTTGTLATTDASSLTSGTLSAARLPALTGDVTTSAGSAATTVAKLTETSGPTSLTIGTIADGQFLKRNGSTIVSAAAGGTGDALTTNPLSQFAATTSAQLAGVLSDETGSGGGFVRATSPTIATPSVSSPAFSGSASTTLDMGSHKVTGVADPTAAQDAATKHYVDTPATPGTYAYGATVSLDVSASANYAPTNTVTGTMAITLTNGADGYEGTIGVVQDATGHAVTIAASGRTVTYAGNVGLPSAANERFGIGYQFATENSVAYLHVFVTEFDVATISTHTHADASTGGQLNASNVFNAGTVSATYLPASSTSAAGVVQLEDSHASTSTTKAPTSNQLKTAYDLANAALPLTGGTMTGALALKTVTGITASTTQTQGQGALTGDVNRVATVANANDTVTLPTPAAGKRVVVFNDGANNLKIYPPSGADLGAGTNTSLVLQPNCTVSWLGTSSTLWEREVPTASTTVYGMTSILDSVASTSTGVAAAPNSVKTAYDLANAAMPKAGGTMTGGIKFTATAVTLSSNAATLDVSTNDYWQLATAVGANFTLTLTNGADGNTGFIAYKQDATGGRKVTIAASGRTLVTSPAGVAKINSTTVTAANASVVLSYVYFSAGGTSYVSISATDTVAADFTLLEPQLRLRSVRREAERFARRERDVAEAA